MELYYYRNGRKPPVKTLIILTDLVSNDAIKKYFENAILSLKVTTDQIYSDIKIQEVFDSIRGLDGILKVVDGKVYFDLEGFNIKIELNSDNEWDVCLDGEQVSSHNTLHDAVFSVIDIHKKNFVLVSNI